MWHGENGRLEATTGEGEFNINSAEWEEQKYDYNLINKKRLAAIWKLIFTDLHLMRTCEIISAQLHLQAENQQKFSTFEVWKSNVWEEMNSMNISDWLWELNSSLQSFWRPLYPPLTLRMKNSFNFRGFDAEPAESLLLYGCWVIRAFIKTHKERYSELKPVFLWLRMSSSGETLTSEIQRRKKLPSSAAPQLRGC